MKTLTKCVCLVIGIPTLAINLGFSSQNNLLTLRFPIEVKGDEFRQYKTDVTQDIEDKSYSLNAEAVRIFLDHKGRVGKVVIDFPILRNGTVGDVRLVESSGDKKLDKAAVEAITASSPHSALPAGFKGEKLDVRFEFSSKPSLRISPFGPVKVVAGQTQQFSTGEDGVTWAVVGSQCSKSDGGSISTDGLFTAPKTIPDPPSFRITATQTSPSVDSTFAEVTVVSRSH
ncbi:MAG TPA: energy transducer TonB [Terriglobales bacterium]|nr:energy transducer TonB [Terriglobales bacterium]